MLQTNAKIIYKESMFRIDYWSVWDRLETGMDRTNNVQESFHHVLNLNADKQHVGLHQLISILLSVNQKMEHSIATHLAAGVPEKKVSKAIKERNLAIKRLFELYQGGNIAISD